MSHSSTQSHQLYSEISNLSTAIFLIEAQMLLLHLTTPRAPVLSACASSPCPDLPAASEIQLKPLINISWVIDCSHPATELLLCPHSHISQTHFLKYYHGDLPQSENNRRLLYVGIFYFLALTTHLIQTFLIFIYFKYALFNWFNKQFSWQTLGRQTGRAKE